ncbi:hypothetical protein ABZ840_32370 [Streptomyces sp. NPDC047117]|uniref:hypothetical protein n=1 Tax=Streptomyces sp. NPDC047117 TaxID=3155379 RepID=UPI0033EE162E
MGGHDRLVVDYTLLESSKSNLQEIKKVMDDIDDHSEDIQDIWGHDSIAEKMDEFVSNWDNYREKLVDNVKDLGEHVEGALKNFKKQDLDLKNATEKHGKNGGK